MNNFDFWFFFNSILLGIGLAMDAFSVSIANGLNEPNMKLRKSFVISGTFAFFQIIMPLIGWFCVSKIAELFSAFQKFIPWIALIILMFIGGKMIFDSIKSKENDEKPSVGFLALIIQGIATSIDALSVGFTTSSYNFISAFLESIIIGIVTFGICLVGVILGKKIGSKLSNKATIIGGCILIIIGIEIFVKGMIQ